MLNGYFSLGGPQLPIPLPVFKGTYKGNHINARNRGQWAFDTKFENKSLNIPSRDKRVTIFASSELSEFGSLMEFLDSEYDHANYRGKLNLILPNLSSSFVGIVNNISNSTHGSLAVLTNDTPLYFYGLHDVELEYTYLMWTASQEFFQSVLDAKPLRYLVYRMPVLQRGAVFLPGEILCSKWWRLNKNHPSTLYALNAIERRLFGASSI